MKSTRDLSPPQTYSRLFRPWDGEKSSCPKGKEVGKTGPLCDVVKTESVSAPFEQHNPIFDHQELYPEYANRQQILDYKDYYGIVPLFDPLARCMMEQEYARVIAEDAQTKILNLRRQRPKKFKCPHCNVAFSNNGQLKGHIRIHTGERPFKCDDSNCGKTFTRNEELTRHKRIHTGLRPFACRVCGKKFGRRDHLKKHTKIHFAPERLFPSTVFLPYTFLPTY
ncbi:zinc finger protein 41-like [Phlebotomus argentipes]|uniref:zinc finger protein 41-like n=1 Tax=Phlebotomus argentipes TaxID=94469 RepID=UPI002893073C|nr:zinc finger protein 41-like [Phlebotomus argentipes]